MEAIAEVVRSARRRMMMREAVARISSASAVAGGALLVALLGARLSSAWVPWLGSPYLLWGAIGVALLAVSAWTAWRVRRPSDLQVASAVDVSLGLHDRLSTAVAVADRRDPFALAAREDGARIAQDRRVKEGIPQACPIGLNARSFAGLGLMVVAVVAWLMIPPVPVAIGQGGSSAGDREELAAARAAAAARLEPVVRQIESNDALAEALGLGDQDQGTRAGAGREGESAEAVRREAARRMTELTKRLDQLMQSEKAQQLDALKDALSRVEPASGSPVQGLAEALKRGDAAAAREKLDELARQAADPSLDAATRESLAKSVEQLASQIEKAAQGKESLQKALQQSGLDPALASNPAALEQALAKSDQLNEAQKESVRQAARAQRSANESLEKLAKSMGECAGQCRNPASSKSGGASGSKGGQSAGEQPSQSASASSLAPGSEMLSEMEQLAQMMQDAQSARSQCAGGGTPTQLASGSSSSRSGKAGQGRGNQGGPSNGGSTPTQETPFGTKSRKERVANQGGDVIARQLVESPPVVGESRAKLKQIAQEISRGVEEGTGEDPVPPHLREAHRRYFGEMRRRIEQKTGPSSP